MGFCDAYCSATANSSDVLTGGRLYFICRNQADSACTRILPARHAIGAADRAEEPAVLPPTLNQPPHPAQNYAADRARWPVKIRPRDPRSGIAARHAAALRLCRTRGVLWRVASATR